MSLQAVLEADPLAANDAELRRLRRIGLGVVLGSLLGFIVWAALAPLDEGVPAAGQVAIDTKRKTVQHATGGIIRKVLVREGDQVAPNALLMELDAAAAQANFEQVRQRYLANLAAQARLQAERSGMAAPSWPAELLANPADRLATAHIATQTALLATRRSGLDAERRAAAESIAGQRAQLVANETSLPLRRAQLANVESELTAIRDLVKDGYAPMTRQRELERQADDLRLSLADLTGANQRLTRAIQEIGLRQQAREAEWRKEVDTQLTEVTRDAQADADRLRQLRDELGRTEVRAPSGGQVVGLAFQTPGGVVPPMQRIMDIVPQGEQLVIECRLPPMVIDRVHDGLPVDVRFAAFAHAPQLVVEGQVLSVSRDALADPQTNQTFFLARVGITPQGLKTLGQRQLQPGMQVEVVLRTGERTLLTYLLHPLTKRIAASMKEE